MSIWVQVVRENLHETCTVKFRFIKQKIQSLVKINSLNYYPTLKFYFDFNPEKISKKFIVQLNYEIEKFSLNIKTKNDKNIDSYFYIL